MYKKVLKLCMRKSTQIYSGYFKDHVRPHIHESNLLFILHQHFGTI